MGTRKRICSSSTPSSLLHFKVPSYFGDEAELLNAGYIMRLILDTFRKFSRNDLDHQARTMYYQSLVQKITSLKLQRQKDKQRDLSSSFIKRYIGANSSSTFLQRFAVEVEKVFVPPVRMEYFIYK